MQTSHDVHVGDARDLPLPANSVELVVTSPPYPMIEMWDPTFAALDPEIQAALSAGEGDRAFRRMHAVLDGAWDELARVLVEGGIAIINVGDATRTVEDAYALYPNGSRITRGFRERDFAVLPDVVWRKPTNTAAKFMGSGMLPPNAYVTLDHERLLVFRNGNRRSYEPGADRRYEAAYFWEERNQWFSDVWEVTGAPQAIDAEARDRSGAFPVEIPFRLINMFSTYGETVLDPFWGTGTTTAAAMTAGRHSVGVDRDESLVGTFEEHLAGLPDRSRSRQQDRLVAHEAFVADRQREGNPPAYEAIHYGFPVTTKQERHIRLYGIDRIDDASGGATALGPADGDGQRIPRHVPDPDRRYVAHHSPVEP